MNRKPLVSTALFLASFALAFVTAGQTPPPGAANAPSPTNPVPDWTLTPGAASLTPGAATTPGTTSPPPPATTVRSGADLYGIPNTTPPGMPAYSLTPVTPGAPLSSPNPAAVRRRSPGAGGAEAGAVPATASDCAGRMWRDYPALRFPSRERCEAWVKRNAGAAGGIRAPIPAWRTPGAGAPTPRGGASDSTKKSNAARTSAVAGRTPTPVPSP